MSANSTDFRRQFPAFINQEMYPGPVIDMWLSVATKLLNPARWVELLDLGCYLYTAHNLIIEVQAMKDSASGKVPGTQAGPLNSKSVGPASASYDSSSAVEEGAGNYNETIYGRRFIRMAKLLGAGPVTPVPSGFPSSGEYDGAWQGVLGILN